MDQTNVDDMLIEMITPKVTEIQQKFGNGEALSQDNINTLLLKSQYNHINHLDLKLNEVVADVSSLKGDFSQLEISLKSDFSQLRTELKAENTELRGDFNQLETSLSADSNQLRTELTGKFDLLSENVEKLMAKAVNKNITLLIFVMGFFLTLSKLIDRF